MTRRFDGRILRVFDRDGRIGLPPEWVRSFAAGGARRDSESPAAAVCVYGLRRPELRFYPADAATDVERRIALLPRGTPERIALERLFIGKSIRLDFDHTGGLTVPLPILDLCGLAPDTEVVCDGQDDHIGVWPVAAWPGDPVA